MECGGRRAGVDSARAVAAGKTGALRISAHGRARNHYGAGLRVGGRRRTSRTIGVGQPAASPRARDHWTVRIHRHGSRLDCHRSRASAVGGAGDHPHTRCGDADARSRRPDDAVRTALPHARRDRRRIDRANGARHHMREFFSSIGLPEIVAAALVLALNAYVLMAGADFGGGVWDLIASGPRREAQRALIAESIGPIWEANHVWLIVVVVVLFTAFPDAFGALG